MKKYFFTLCLASLAIITNAQQYSVAGITEAMKKNAFSVKREERIEFDITDIDRAYYRVHKVVTVLSEAGKDELFFYEFSDQFRSLEEVTIRTYDAAGNQLHKYTKGDLTKQATGEGIIPDGKVYYIMTPSPSFPITIQIDYEIKHKGLLHYHDYEVQLPEQAVEKSEYIARVAVANDLRFKPKNTTLQPAVAVNGNTKEYKWTVNNLPALEEEEGSVSRESRYPKILLAPNKFELDGYEGDMSTWQSFGRWYGSLCNNMLNLSAERKAFFQNMVKDIASPVEKIRAIYSYLQNNFRYVSIQLGIGGFKPFEASFTDNKKYGDCKALSNYTQACLDAIGIKSYQALINASFNKAPVEPDFPHNSFNHVIVCVPMEKDSIWLECTSNTNEFGVLGSFTENRNALLITENGGQLVPTPVSKAASNRFTAHTTVKLGEDASGMADVKLFTTGEYRDDFMQLVFDQKRDDQKQFFVRRLGFLQPDEFDIVYEKNSKEKPVSLQLAIEKIPEFTAGSKQFLNPRIYKIWQAALPKAENRTQDYYFPHPLIKTDTTVYKLPEGYIAETLPKAKSIQFEYGSYKTTYAYDAATKSIITTARLELITHKIPVAKFAATKQFFEEVLAEYTEKIVIKKQ
jgi:hypothetical protein